MNLIICGKSGSGKTTAIKKILAELNEPIYGFWTEKVVGEDSRVYFHSCRAALDYASCVGTVSETGAQCFPQVFDQIGVRSLSDIPKGSLVLMDEIGFMERDAKEFQQAIFRILDGCYRVIAAVRDRDTELITAVKNHPKSCCISAAIVRQEGITAFLPILK